MHNNTPTTTQPAEDDDSGLEAFQAARREAEAAGIPQDGPLGQKAADLIRSRAGADAQGETPAKP
ncbi:hypothetical protein [Methylibium petroleiphilum]|uniref:Uncharacterized protein n=1 Tax=Methylibium petroleiphilum (strain ATCC BAA-1232 / LMG 22953 / PM1) TaxID=420662 RepID=A2SMX9_METPP|nr:hypothetical protein [Methylibium petroleiphilum]ABM96918.1 hypothetical protein Mpe_B0140 [Methylibium petroleiphilum PM1]